MQSKNWKINTNKTAVNTSCTKTIAQVDGKVWSKQNERINVESKYDFFENVEYNSVVDRMITETEFKGLLHTHI